MTDLFPQHVLTAALEYAERGWPVFPCHSITSDGHCTCPRGELCPRPGKHPRINRGRNGATTDAETIERWWSMWPESNVAVVTGVESGVVVIDLDSPEAVDHVEQLGVPPTLEQRTGSGGTHLLFERPPGDHRFRTATNIGAVSGLDSRADGGYIIAPPSKHVSGGRYEWMGGVDPAPSPGWWDDMIRSPSLSDGPVPPPPWNPDGELPATITEMLEHIPADDYTVWRDVGMAIHFTDPSEEGFAAFDWWSSTSPKYDPGSVRKEWRNWSRRGHAVANPVTLGTIRRIAEGLGWTDPDLEHGAEIAQRITESAQFRITERLQINEEVRVVESPPDALIPDTGLIGDIARWIEATAIRPQPRLALAAAAAFVGALAGRKYQSPTGLRTNLYLVGLAPTGAGKNHARSAIQRLATAAGVDDFLGADHIASGSAIVNGLKGQPVKLYMLDEFGLLLQSLTTTGASGHRRDIITRLLELYSQAQSTYRGTEYADTENRPASVIHNPHVCVYGTSTGSSFWPALSGSHVLDGTLNRLLVVDTGEDVPARLRSTGRGGPPEGLVDAVKELAAASPGGRGNLAGRGGSGLGEPAHTVPMTEEVAEAEFAFACDMDRAGGTEAGRAIYSRVSENAIKLALLHAVSIAPANPLIGPESWTWGRDVALWCANVLMHHAGKHIAGSEAEASLKAVYFSILRGGAEGVTQTDLFRSTRGMTKRAREDAIQTLEQMEGIQRFRRKPDGAGRPRTVYVALTDDLFQV